jgi:glutamate synthase (NADPH/NADH) small chain
LPDAQHPERGWRLDLTMETANGPRKKKKTIRMIPQARTPAHEQDPQERARNFKEVNCGYLIEDAMLEAERCLMCPEQPCVSGCPVNIAIPDFIQKITDKDYRGAYDVITASNLLPSVCGRVCPQENQCEGVCTVGESLEPVAIGRLERWVGDMAIKEGWSNIPYIEPNGFRVGIVGSGPAGMACAADMAKAGCEVTVYEAFHEPGGVLKYGIPDFRLPNPIVDAEIDKLRQLGVRFECNTLVGRLFSIEQMVEEMGFHAVFIGTGAGYPSFMGIPGESLNGVLSANELLTRCNLMHAREFPNYDTPLQPGKHVAVIGAGNTAMDALRVCLRLGADTVSCLYRRSRAEAPARAEEIHHAEEEGVRFNWLVSPVEILDDGNKGVRAVRCVRMTLGEPDDSGRRRPVPEAGSEFEIEADMVVYAIGTNANPIIGQTSKLKLNKRGYIATDENLATSIPGVYAGGDIVTGAATVIEAMGAGRRAARNMKAFLGLRDTDFIYQEQPGVAASTLFGIERAEHGYVRVRSPR